MDLSKFDTTKGSQEGAVLEILNPLDGSKIPDKEDNPVTITVVGKDSETFRKTSNKIMAGRISRATSRGKLKLNPDELEAEAIDLLVTCTLRWSGIEVDGKELEFSQANVKTVYIRFPWIKEQVEDFIAERVNFLGN